MIEQMPGMEKRMTDIQHVLPEEIEKTSFQIIERELGERGRSLPAICRALAVQPWEVIVYSSQNGLGRDKLLELIGEELGEEGVGSRE